MSVDKTHTAVLVLNRNMREMTEKLISTIQRNTLVSHSIYALDAASDPDQVVLPDIGALVGFKENRRWAWSFAEGMRYAASAPTYEHLATFDLRDHDWVMGYEWKEPTHFWLLCNDAQLDSGADTLGRLLQNMPDDACQIHPYQMTHPQGSPQGWAGFNQVRTGRRVHNVAFVEFVCPLITRDFYERCLKEFKSPPVGPHFPYGWGVDYEMAYFGHKLGLKSYICDMVGMTHHPGTTHLNHEKTKVEDNNQMRVLARNTMLDVLEQRYGRNWGQIFADAARAAGVDPKAFLEWSEHDRALALRGARA